MSLASYQLLHPAIKNVAFSIDKRIITQHCGA